MKLLSLSLALSFLSFSAHGVGASKQEDGTAAIKTADGYLLVWNEPEIHFTISIQGKEVKAMNSTEHVFFSVDGMAFQVQCVAVGQFLKEAEKQGLNELQILAAHQDWESKFIESSLLGKKLEVQSTPQKLPDGSEALLWRFKMPEGISTEVKAQMYLTMVRAGHVILLNGSVPENTDESAVQKLLMNSAATLKLSRTRINVRDLSESIRKGSLQ
jgi:hypothetical protein